MKKHTSIKMFRQALFLLFINSVLSYTVDSKPQYDLEQIDTHFEDFVSSYNKSYHSLEERVKRLAIFLENVKEIIELNRNSDTAVFAVNQFSDLTKEEFIATYTGAMTGDFGGSCGSFNLENILSAPEEFDWRTRNVVTPAKNQQKCGSCWAYSATGSVESQYAMKYQTQVDLSEQQLVDCETTGSNGCGGGNPTAALSTLISEGGQMSESDYPYINSQSTCAFDASKVQVRLSGCYSQRFADEESVKNVLASVGPLSFILDANSVRNYHGGVLPDCQDTDLNHAVLLVGYGTENGVPFWAVKNSWGESFGDQGFFKIRRGVNACGMMGAEFCSAIVA